jgi:LPXTG-motif cell wall-anchored protein
VFKRAITWATALGLGLVAGLALSATPAQAEYEVRSPFKVEYNRDCTVTVSIYGPQYHVTSDTKTAGLAVKTDDDSAFTAPVPATNGGPLTANESLTVQLNQSGFVYYRWFAGPERGDIPAWDLTGDWADQVAALETTQGRSWNAGDGNEASFISWKKKWLRVPTCATPGEPTSSQLECAAGGAPTIAGAIEIPDTEGVQYLLNGEEIEAGTHELVPGAYTVTAEPKPGYVLDKDVNHAWDFTVVPINGCPGTPGTPGPPGDPGAPGADGQDGTDGEGGMNQASNDKQLPQTGSPAVLLFVLGLLLTIAGGVGMALGRRKPQVQ